MSRKGREGGQKGGGKHAEGTGVVLLLLARVTAGPEASPGGMDLLSLFFGSKTSGLRALPAFEATASPNPPQHSFPGAGRQEGPAPASTAAPPAHSLQGAKTEGQGGEDRGRRDRESRVCIPGLCSTTQAPREDRLEWQPQTSHFGADILPTPSPQLTTTRGFQLALQRPTKACESTCPVSRMCPPIPPPCLPQDALLLSVPPSFLFPFLLS